GPSTKVTAERSRRRQPGEHASSLHDRANSVTQGPNSLPSSLRVEIESWPWAWVILSMAHLSLGAAESGEGQAGTARVPFRRRSLADVLQQLAALLGALPARSGAGGHVLVIRELPAGRGALVAARRAARQHGAGEGALAGTQGRTALAALLAVGAELR